MMESVMDVDPINSGLTPCAFAPAWMVRVELAERDDARVREAVTAAVGLRYGAYQDVAFESGGGMQFFQPLEGSVMGDVGRTVEMPVRVLSFHLPRDPDMLARAVEAVRDSPSYEEPVISVLEVLSCRADDTGQRDNPSRWWNRGFSE